MYMIQPHRRFINNNSIGDNVWLQKIKQHRQKAVKN